MNRVPAVAGSFYPAKKDQLYSIVKSMIDEDAAKERAQAVIVPHAGIVYSGRVAAEVYSRIEIPESVILIGPNHHQVGSFASVYTSGSWTTPLGEVEIDETLCRLITESAINVLPDKRAHIMEHSLEVQLPFLQFLRPEVKIVPIIIQQEQGEENVFLNFYLELAESLAAMQEEHNFMVIASTDMTHFEPEQTARKKDAKAIEHIVDFDAEGLYHTVKSDKISMCGAVPVTIALEYCKKTDCSRVEVVAYTTSAEVSGDFESVVGYLGAIIQ